MLFLLGCNGIEERSEPHFVWAGKYESGLVSTYLYCDGVTSPDGGGGLYQVILGSDPRVYFKDRDQYHTIVSLDDNRIVGENTFENREGPSYPPDELITFRTELVRNPPTFIHSVLHEPINYETLPECTQSGYVFIGRLARIDSINRSCKKLDPPCTD